MIFEKGQWVILALIIIKVVSYRFQNRENDKQNQINNHTDKNYCLPGAYIAFMRIGG